MDQKRVLDKIIALKGKKSSDYVNQSIKRKKVSNQDLLNFIVADVKQDYQRKQKEMEDFQKRKSNKEGWTLAPCNQ